jgi:hypothetical protein
MFALYAGSVTIGRLSLRVGPPSAWDYFPQQQMGPNRFLPMPWCSRPGRPARPEDLMPRFGGVRRVLQREDGGEVLWPYVTTFNTVDEWANHSPAAGILSADTRGWTDTNQIIRRSEPLNPAANGECGPGIRSWEASPSSRPTRELEGWNNGVQLI